MALATAFLRAGTFNVVATLWPIRDRDAERIMTSFYRILEASSDPAEALRRTQIQEIRDGTHPSVWAAFQLYGRTLSSTEEASP